MVYMIVAYVTMLARPIDAIRTQLQSLQQADASIVRVRGLISTRSALTDGTETLPPGALPVAFDHVSFAYNDNNHDPHEMQDTIQLYPEPVEGPIFHPTTAHTERRTPPNRLVLDDLSFSLAPGRTLGLLGRTGSGKTTIARLLFRLYDSQEGAVRLGHIDVRQVRLDALRTRVGFVTQDVQLFEASLRDNLTFFNPGIPDERLYAILHELGLNHWLHTLPGGLDSPVSSATLSAGEAQLIALARVFLQDAGLIILDEASSRLDPITGMLLEGALDRL
ncbi:MAG: ABC transporter ATP-binding protein, partial [Anaerolineae bacterium]|nr:ABC transporter ATP-binding protein [Anaerolineae bacterium]